jgi:hypothetical protein
MKLAAAAAAATAAAAAPATPAVSAAERTLAQVQTPTRTQSTGTTTAFPVVDAYGGRVVWSDHDQAADAWRLMQYEHGAVSAVPVTPRATPFDVDLGRGPDGGTSAVYTRCAKRLPRDEPAVVPGRHVRYGCDVYRFDFASGKESRVGAVSAGGDEAWPAIWGSRIAFVRTYPERGGRRGTTPYLYTRSLHGGAPSKRLRRPSSAVRAGRRTVYLPYRIAGLDVGADKVAYTWTRAWDGADQSFVYTASLAGHLNAVANGASMGGGADVTFRRVAEPALNSGRVSWLFDSSGEPSYEAAFLRRAVTRSGRPAGGAATDREARKAVAFAQDARTTYWIDGGAGARDTPANQPGGAFALKATGSPRFTPGVPAGWLSIPPPR